MESDEYEYYEIQALELHLAHEISVILEPVGIDGINATGIFGKTDLHVRGHKDEKVVLLLIQDEDDSEKLYWDVWESRDQEERIPLDKKTFERVLDGWLERWADIVGKLQ